MRAIVVRKAGAVLKHTGGAPAATLHHRTPKLWRLGAAALLLLTACGSAERGAHSDKETEAELRLALEGLKELNGGRSMPAMDLDPPPAGTQGYTIQVGAWSSPTDARQYASKLWSSGFPAYIFRYEDKKQQVWHRVRVGVFPTKPHAESFAAELVPYLTAKDSKAWVTRLK